MDKDELIQMLREAVAEVVESHPLSDEEIVWVRMAIKAEAERTAFRKAVIEKSLISLIWLGLATAGAWLAEYFSQHWRW